MEPSILMQSGRYTLTRSQVAKRIGTSTSTVRRLEFVKLNPVADEHGVFRFDAEEVDALAEQMGIEATARRSTLRRKPSKSRTAGTLAARTFSMFARRWSLPRIVASTKQTPERVRALYHQWVTSLEDGEFAMAARTRSTPEPMRIEERV